MNFLYKGFLVALLFSITFNARSQDLAKRIPSDALAVASIKGKNLIDLMSLTEFNNSFIGKQLLAKLSQKDKSINSVDDFGFNLSSTFYYFNRGNDSVTYNCFLAPVKDIARIDELYSKSEQHFTIKNNLRYHYNTDSTQIALWNNEMFLYAIGSANDAYFSRPEIMERFGLTAFKTDYLTDTVYTMVDSAMVAVDVAIEAPAEGVKVPEINTVKPPVKNKIGSKKPVVNRKGKLKKPAKNTRSKKTVVKPVEVISEDQEVEVDIMPPPPVNDEYSNNSYFSNNNKKKAIVAGWVNDMATDFFLTAPASSILGNKDYVKSIDEKAEATVWISGVDKLAAAYMPAIYSIKGMNILNGYRSATASLYLENNAIKLTSSITLGDELAEMVKKVHKRKLNKQFLKYLNEDKMIGYMAYSMDTKAYLQEYPKLLSKMYGSFYPDEIGMATDLFSLLLDEEAVSKVIKGDGIVVFNGLSQKEVTYKSYDYDDSDFKTKEVTKTKKETLPDFLFMLSTEDTRLLDKLIAYGSKKEIIKSKAGYYELAIPKSPIAVYFTIKNGIIFMGTNSMEMENIVNNRYVANISGKQKKLLSGTNYITYFSGKKLVGKIPAEELGGADKIAKLNDLLNSLGDIYIKTNPIKGNVFSGELSMDIPANQKNSLKYLFSIIENTQK